MPCLGKDLQVGEVGRCHYCQRTMLPRAVGWRLHNPLRPTRDHLNPRWMRNQGAPPDWIWACERCNHLKGSLTMEAWRLYMSANPNWWEATVRVGLREPAKKSPARIVIIEQPETLKYVDWTRPESIPVVYNDPKAQEAFERVYKDRLHMLREPRVL